MDPGRSQRRRGSVLGLTPTNVYLLVPQMLQNRLTFLMLRAMPARTRSTETAPFIELVTDMDTLWSLEQLGGQIGIGPGNNPSVSGNWRFTEWSAANEYWRYGFSGQIGNFMVRVDELGLRFNFVQDLGASANGASGNRYRYQVVLPWVNSITSGAGGAAGLGSDSTRTSTRPSTASASSHKKAMELLVPDAGSLNSELPFAHRDFGGKWQFVMDNLGADVNGVAINNKRRNKGQFISDFRYYVRPLHTEFAEAIFHMREQFVIPQLGVANPSPGYPAQVYNSALPTCPLPGSGSGVYPAGWPTNTTPPPNNAVPSTNMTLQGVTVPVVETLNPVPSVNYNQRSRRRRRRTRLTSKPWVFDYMAATEYICGGLLSMKIKVLEPKGNQCPTPVKIFMTTGPAVRPLKPSLESARVLATRTKMPPSCRVLSSPVPT